MAPLKLQDVIFQEQDHSFNQISMDEVHAGASGSLVDYVLGSTDSTLTEFNNFINADLCEENLPIDFDLDMFGNEEQVDTPNPNQNGENTNQILGDLVNSTIGITPTETPMAIDDADIGEILNEINIIVIDVPLQDQNNPTIFPNVPTILIPEVNTEVTNEAIPVVGQEVKNRGRGRPETSDLEAKVDDIKDQSLRRRIFNNASSARHRRNQKRKHEDMEQALIDEAEKKAKLTVEVELLEKQVEEFKAKILDMIKKP